MPIKSDSHVSGAYTIAVKGGAPFDAIVAEAKELGFQVKHALPYLGLFTGHASPALAKTLKALAGVASVEVDEAFQIRPEPPASGEGAPVYRYSGERSDTGSPAVIDFKSDLKKVW
jgi:hypothetical protein